VLYALAGGASAATIGPWLVLVIAACGLIEVTARTRPSPGRRPTTPAVTPFALVTAPVTVGGLGAVAWVAFKVGALSYGGGFVIIPSCSTTSSTPTTG
jgi:chromate transporter